jgi:tRNA-splicing ligase RtcB (3'-phosphate/5'-hydroxy nucleic acid ligase)
MEQVISTEQFPIKLWLGDIEAGALSQAKNLANLPFIWKHVAIMPDSHQGYGMPIGGVIATDGVIIPNAVGVDIGCGMCAVRTSLRNINTSNLKKIMGRIRELVPVGFEKHKQPQDYNLMPLAKERDLADGVDQNEYPIISRQFTNGLKSLGTLGGGNHFIEIQKGDDDNIWLMIHSGSRNIGLQVANHYNKLAKQMNDRWHAGIPQKWDLAFLPIETKEGKDYLREMRYCVDYALANRKLMMERVKEAIGDVVQIPVEFDEMINIAHNYAAFEEHYGKHVIVHRKGATRADKGLMGIIPGSQGTNSFIVEGKGNQESFKSCSHGAGRVMGRKEASKKLNLKKEIDYLDKMGVIHGLRNTRDLDEAPSAYKDINKVMENQQDLVDVRVKLRPMAVIKG